MKKGIPSRAAGGLPPRQNTVALSPRAQQLFDLGRQKSQSGDFEGAASAFRAVAEMRPDLHQAHFNLGRALIRLGRDSEAIGPLQRTLVLHPRHLKALTNLAGIHKQLGNLTESMRLLQKAREQDPRDPSLAISLASILLLADRPHDALTVYRKAIEDNPDAVSLHYNLGNLVRRLDGDDAANPHYLRAVELDPDHANAWTNLGITHRRDHPGKAVQYFSEAIARQPDSLTALYSLLSIEQRYCDFDATDTAHANALRAFQGDAYRGLTWQTAGNWVYESLFAPLPWTAIHALQDHIAALIDDEVRMQGSLPEPPASPVATDRRRRIGYLSPSFGNHPVGQVTLSLIPAHDRARFEVHAFSTHPNGSDGTETAIRHRAAFDAFHEIGNRRARDAAAYIQSRGIDILIDLDGYMDNTSPPILAFRPAPVQVFWLGHGGGLGLPFVDYLIADAIVLPTDEDRHYREAIVRLPEIYHCTDRPPIADDCPPRSHWGLPDNATVYCVFNNPDKIDRRAFDCWMRILKGVEGSVLWFSPFRQNSETLLVNLQRYAMRQGVDPGRLILSERVPDKSLYLARIRHADLMLDTFTLNASSTALDSLWAGLPLLAMRGDRFSNRISNTMLHAMGLDDLVCADLIEYERRAIELGRDPAARSELRKRLHDQRDTTPLFDVNRFARHLELAYASMWERHQSGLPPSAFDVPSLPDESA